MRPNVLLCSSSKGENIKPLEIGKYQNPRYFSGVATKCIHYEPNKKAQITSTIFSN